MRTTGLVLALAGVDPAALAPQGRPPFVAVRPCEAIAIITGFVLVGRSLANSGQTPTRDKILIVDYSVGWHLETNSFHYHVRLIY